MQEQPNGMGEEAMAAPVLGGVGVFLAGDDRIEPLPQQARQRRGHVVRAPRVGQGPHEAGRESAMRIELSLGQAPGVAGALAALEIGGPLPQRIERRESKEGSRKKR